MPTETPDPRLLALGREQERLQRRLGALEALVRTLAGDVAEVASRLRDDDEDDDQAGEPARRSWLLVAGETRAAGVLEELCDWVERVYLRYPGAALASCWLWHPAVVEELWWLRQAHHDAYHPRHGSITKIADWHDRHRPGVARRIHAALADCELALHDTPPAPPVVPLAQAAPRVATTWAEQRTTPAPTEAELAEADRHDQQRTHHR